MKYKAECVQNLLGQMAKEAMSNDDYENKKKYFSKDLKKKDICLVQVNL